MHGWINGPEAVVSGPDRDGMPAPMVTLDVGYLGAKATYTPTAGRPFPVRARLRVGHPPRGGVLSRTRLRLPSGVWCTDDAPICLRLAPGAANAVDCTDDPAANCPTTLALLPDDTVDLGWRDLPAGTAFEIRLWLRADRTMAGGPLAALVDSEFATAPLTAAVGMRVFPGPVVVGDVRVQVRPRWIPMGRHIEFTVLTSDDRTGRPLEGQLRVHAYDVTGRPRVEELATNQRCARTFHARFGSCPELPRAELLVPGYNAGAWLPLPVFAPA